MPRLVHQLDEQDGRLVFQGDARVGIDVPEDLAQVVHLRRERGRVGAHAGLAEMPAESGIGRVSEGVGPIGPIQLNGTEQHVDAALARAGDQVVQQVEMVVGDQVAGRVGSLPVAPEGQPQAVPTHAGELRHVLVDHLLAIGVDVAGGAVIRGGGQHVVRAEEGDFLLRISPPHDALLVEIDATVGDLRLSRRCSCDERPKNQGFRGRPYALNHTPPRSAPYRLGLDSEPLIPHPSPESPGDGPAVPRCYCLFSSSMTLPYGPIDPRIGT